MGWARGPQAPEARGTMKLDFRVRRSSKPAETRAIKSNRIFGINCASLLLFERVTALQESLNDRRTLNHCHHMPPDQCLVMNNFHYAIMSFSAYKGFNRHAIQFPYC